jgi:hypothetical protein
VYIGWKLGFHPIYTIISASEEVAVLKVENRDSHPTDELDSVNNKNKPPTSRQIYSVQLDQLPTDLPFGTATSSKEKAIIGAVAPKPPLSTHLQSKLLGFLAFSHAFSFSTPSVIPVDYSFRFISNARSNAQGMN